MASKNGTNGHAHHCRPHIVAAGLPHRGDIILKREKNLYPLTVGHLVGRRGDIRFEDAAESLTFEMLEDVFTSKNGTTLFAAAFLAGRCEPDDARLGGKLTGFLRDLLDSASAGNLGVLARPYVEAAMSLALRGDRERGHDALLPLATTQASEIEDGYLAAFYLAQMGDPSGWPAMLEALRDSSEHTRLMAVRHLAAFLPYDGQAVSGKTIDVRNELVKRLKDHDTYVRAEIPYYLAEADVKDLKELLAPVAKNDKSKDVREAAREILERA